MADKTEKIQIRLTPVELGLLKHFGETEAEGMSDWICQAIWRRAKQLGLKIVPPKESHYG